MNRTAERTKESLPTFVLEPISYAELSPWAVKRFESYSERFISPKEYRKENFSGFWKFSQDGVTVFVARQEKKGYEMAYVYANRGAETEFWGEIGDKPLENWKYGYLFFFGTNEEKRDRGIATEWIPFFDGLSRHFFKKPLTSGSLLCEIPDRNGGNVSPIARIFERHAESGTAKPVGEISWKVSYAFCRRVSKVLARKRTP